MSTKIFKNFCEKILNFKGFKRYSTKSSFSNAMFSFATTLFSITIPFSVAFFLYSLAVPKSINTTLPSYLWIPAYADTISEKIR